ncbi:fibrinogen alpha chain [Conger conger]|uniref:fibrinogen alpha chain n=1 Tax=Conger conger TaxID=82655 RepID=UPI002A5AB9F1|nr:fibrinogen alpha chain [Conger conger]
MQSMCGVWKQSIQPLQRERLGYPRGRGPWCPADSQPPLCTDEDWDIKCPSGCRLQGHIDTTEQSLLDHFGQICGRAKEDRHKAEKTMLWTTQIYGANRKTIVENYVAEAKYLEILDKLQKNLTSLRSHATELSMKMKSQYERIKQQIAAIYRTEVDIDIRIRACQGSCKNAEVYNIDKESYRLLGKELQEFHQISEQGEQLAGDTRRLKKKPLNDNAPILLSFKRLPFAEQEFLTHYEDIEQYELEVENMTCDLSDKKSFN